MGRKKAEEKARRDAVKRYLQQYHTAKRESWRSAAVPCLRSSGDRLPLTRGVLCLRLGMTARTERGPLYYRSQTWRTG